MHGLTLCNTVQIDKRLVCIAATTLTPDFTQRHFSKYHRRDLAEELQLGAFCIPRGTPRRNERSRMKGKEKREDGAPLPNFDSPHCSLLTVRVARHHYLNSRVDCHCHSLHYPILSSKKTLRRLEEEESSCAAVLRSQN
jgi:hypothetical protein